MKRLSDAEWILQQKKIMIREGVAGEDILKPRIEPELTTNRNQKKQTRKRRSKVSLALREEIRNSYGSIRSDAKKYNLSPTTIQKIKNEG